MYSNLRAEMARRKISGADLAEQIGISVSTFSQKFTGKYGFTLDEAFAIKKILGTDISLEELFEKDEQ